MKAIGLGIFVMGMIYLMVETKHFGSNFWPESDMEVIADGIGGIICSIGFAVIAMSKLQPKEHNEKDSTRDSQDNG